MRDVGRGAGRSPADARLQAAWQRRATELNRPSGSESTCIMPSSTRGPGLTVETDPLFLALAGAIRSAVRRRVHLVTWAVENDVELVEPCGCQRRTIQEGCVCKVELPTGARWMRAAANRIRDGRAPGGPPPRRSCPLCRGGDHDLEPMVPIRVNASDGTELGTSWVAVRVRRSAKADRGRCERAGCPPPGTHDAQTRAAGLG